MAQNTWINITADKATATKTESAHVHNAVGGTAAAGDFTISFDSAVVTSLAVFETLLKAARARVIAGGLK